MATLKEIAERASVSMLTAFTALSGGNGIDDMTRQHVRQVAQQMNYTLKITQIDIADLAGVAKGTVSYALNNNSLIKPETRKKVWDAAHALGYHLNINARNLRTNRAGVVGYSWHTADDPSRMNNLLDRFIYRVTAAAETQNYHILTFIQPQENADRVYETLISTTRVDGFIISDVEYNDPRIARLSEMDAPFAAFGGMYIDGADFAYVDVDSRQGVTMVVDHLLEQGHERIALITRQPGLPFGDARESAYRQRMQSAGIAVHEDWVAYTPNVLVSASAAAHEIMSAKYPPTAIICTNDLMAFGVKAYLDDIGLRTPDDVALTGYDDDQTAEFLGITSVRQPIDAIAETLFDLLLAEINGEPRAQRQIVFSPELVVRNSTQRS